MPENSPDNTALNGLILAGGRATRMGGIDKGLIPFAGNCLIEHAIARLRPQVARIFISANRNIEHYVRYGLPVLEDRFGHFAGPLAGLLRALEQADGMPVLVVPCDAPLFPTQLAARLREAYIEGATSAVIPHDGSRLQTLFGLYSPTVLSSLTDYLESGQRKVETWVNTLQPVIVDFSNESEVFMNINTETDLQTAQSLLETRRINL
ncbi:MAG: molybdenum cofactor guanylyltransferase MobA [Gammaproteobacteria bacterium]|nr:molybdenum cofactor guanylyltransferase MobA [Gammaproteobacteria bacterium]